MKRRILSLVLAFVMVIGLLPVSAFAATLDNGIRYWVYADYVEITGYGGTATEVVIPAEIEGLPVTAIGKEAFYNHKKLTRIELPDGITTIGDSAFYNCSSLTSINVPDSVTTISRYAFYNCSKLTSINIPDEITVIEPCTFCKCESLTSIDLPDGVTSIGGSAFEYCTNLASIEIPEGVASIGDRAFYNCESLTSIVIPEGITSIGNSTFYNCWKLADIDLPDSVTTIGSSAFTYCSSLTSINLPDGLTTIHSYAFKDCSHLISIEIPDSVTTFGERVFWYCDRLTSVDLPDGLTTIPYGTFLKCYYLTNIEIPEGVTSIEALAFDDCRRLTSIKIPDGVTNIGGGAFQGCTGLTSIEIPGGVTSVDGSTFSGCTSLTDIDLPDGVTSIGNNAFKDCTSLVDLEIPDSVASIGESAFHGCTSLTGIEIPAGVTAVGASTFYGCTSLVSVDLPAGITAVGDSAFYNCTSLTDIDLPDSLTSIGYNAFQKCTSLTSIEIPDGVTSILKNTFYDCMGLTEIDLPDGLTSIGDYAFYKCTSLTGIDFSDSLASIGEAAFAGCASLITIDIPDGVTSIGRSAFDNCTGLTSVDLPDSLTSVSDSLFYGCTSLTEIDLPDGLTTIGQRAFYNCHSLAEIDLPDSLTSAGHEIFQGCTSLTSIVFPDNLTTIGQRAFYGCTSLTSAILPKNLTEIVSFAFDGCTSLTSIDFPDGITYIGSEAFSGCTSLTSIYFDGNTPRYGSYPFRHVTATAYYPENNETWTEDVMKSLGSGITWVGYPDHDHEYEAVIIAPTCTQWGYTTYVCTCGYRSIADKIPALGHTEEIIPAVAATCTETGLTEGVKCAVCDEILDGREIIPAQGHTDEYLAGVSATCTETGLTVGKKCAVCDEILIAQQIVPALGHDWMEADCYRPATCLRCGLTEGEHLDHEFKDGYCIRCECSRDSVFRNYTFCVVDAATGQPVSGANIIVSTQGAYADEDGNAVFELRREQNVAIWIRAAGYPEFTLKTYTPGDKLQEYFYLSSNANAITNAWCNNENVTTGRTQINRQAHALTAKITVTGVSNDTIEKYELVQNGKLIAESTDGNFKVPNARFYADEDVYVRMHTRGDNTTSVYQRKLNIDVETFTLDVEKELNGLLPFGYGASFTFPKGIPMLEGLSISFPNPFNTKYQKFKVYVCDDKVIVTLGIDIDFADDVSSGKKSAKEILKELVDKWASESKKSNERSVNGSLALVVEYGGGKVTRVYGQYNVGFNLATSRGKTFFLGVIPVYAEINAGFGGELRCDKLGYDYKNAKFLIPESEVELNGLLRLYGGLGCHVASAGVYGQGTTKAVLNPSASPILEKVSLAGELGVYAKVKILFFKELCYRYPLLSGGCAWPDHHKQIYTEPYDLSVYQPADRSYLQNQTEWNGGGMETDGGIKTQNLQGSAYTAIEPEIVTCADTTIMLFLDDDGSAGMNYQHLYYCVYDPQQDLWSEPVRVDNDDCPDVEFDVYADKTGIYLLYSQLGDLSQVDPDDYAAILGSAEIVYARYSFDQKKFVDHTNLSQNDTYDTFPQIAVTPEGILATWINNDTDDLFLLNNGNVLMYSRCADQQWTTAAVLADRGATVVSMDAGSLDNEACVALIRDLDCDLSTINDRALFLVDMDGNAVRINNEQDSNDGVQFIRWDGKDYVVWYNGGNLYTTASARSAPAPMLAENIDGLSGDYRFLQMADGSCAILFVQNEQVDSEDENQRNGSNLYGVFCNDGIWGEPVAVTENAQGYYVDAFAAFESKGMLVIPYVRAEVTFTDTDIIKNCQFLSASVVPGKDLEVGEAAYLPSQLTAGSQIELQIPVTNRSWQRVHRLSWSVRGSAGKTVLSGTCDLGDRVLESGCTTDISVVLPKSVLKAGEVYAITVETPDWKESDTANNTTRLDLWYTDFEIFATQVVVGDNLEIQYTVNNAGNTTGDVTINVYKIPDGTDARNELDTAAVSSIAPGMSVAGSFKVKDSYFAAGEDKSVVYLEVISNTREIYDFNDTVAVDLGGIERSTTGLVEDPAELIIPPVIREPSVSYDLCENTDVLINVEENGAVFAGVTGMSDQDYIYSNGVLVIRAAYLQTLSEGMHNYSLSYTHSAMTTELVVTLSITDTRYRSTTIHAEDQTVMYNGQPLVLGQNLQYSTVSSGIVSAEYSVNDGRTWIAGLPEDVGVYQVRLTVGQDDDNRYLAAQCTFRLTITRGTRTINAPEYRGIRDGRTIFGGSVPSGGILDGVVAYGYSMTNDIQDVEKWSTEGILPVVYTETTFYVFAKITGGVRYEDAYSAGNVIVAEAAVCPHANKTAVSEIPATCEAPGSNMYWMCDDCKAILKADGVTKTTIEAEVIPALGHRWMEADCEYPRTCDRCKVTEGAALGHDMGQWYIVTDVTCTADGMERRDCSRCDYHEIRAIEATGHDYKSVVTEPTCTEQGYTTWTCHCGDCYIRDHIDAMGHDMGAWIIVTEATCTSDGTEQRDCSRCDHTETRTVEATGHSHEAVVTAPTCTEQGYTTYTCDCGDSYVGNYVDALGHDMGEWETATAANCTEEGSESRTCSRCDHTETRIVEATGHSHEAVVTAPTCTEQGYTTYTCDCGDSYVDDYVEATGHSWAGPSCSNCGIARLNPFTDVPVDSFYYEPVLWAVENGITTGATATTFNPNGQCLRAHVVTFLHRADGNSEPATNNNPFDDVKSSDFFYKPVLWAVEKGITNGTTATTFGSYANCNRAAVVTFLWRAAGSPEPESTNNPFVDVKATDFFYKSVLWAVENGITNGVDATHFGPTTDCNRAQVVTFLYRAYN